MTMLLEMQNVSKVFGGGFLHGPGTVALDNVSFAIDAERPSITAVAGESGSGKTTLARLLLGFIPPTAGKVLYNGRDTARLSSEERTAYRRVIQAVFQDPFESFNPFYKVDHVLRVPIVKYGLTSSRDEARQLMESALTSVGLRPQDTLGRYPHQLSGGQRQRVMVARTALVKPQVILADEPVSMVDASLRATILESLLTLHRERRISIVYITHDLDTAYQVAENIIVLYRGGVVEAGDVDSVIKHPQHPYAQLLVDSIPEPDVTTRWRDEVPSSSRVEATDVAEEPEESSPAGHRRCSFADRCPNVMPRCRESAPPMHLVGTGHAATCFLYDDKPITSAQTLPAMYPQETGAAPP